LRAIGEKNATARAADLVGQEAPTDHRPHGVGELIAQPQGSDPPPSLGWACPHRSPIGPTGANDPVLLAAPDPWNGTCVSREE